MPTKEEVFEEMKAQGRLGPRVTRVEEKEWQRATLAGPRWFVHCSTVTPEKVERAGGLAPQFAAELCLRKDTLEPLGEHGGQFVVAVPVDEHIDPGSVGFVPEIHGVVLFHGYLGEMDKESNYPDGYIYLFRLDPDVGGPWNYHTKDGVLQHSTEVGFDREIPYTCIRVFHEYNKRRQSCHPYQAKQACCSVQ